MQNAYNQGRIDELELSKVIKIAEGDNHYMPYDPNMFDAVLAQAGESGSH